MQCRNIHFSYPGSDKVLFKGLTLEFNAPGLHALFGPSGVGKSSLAKIILGHLPPSEGHIFPGDVETAFYTHNLERLPGWSNIGKHLDRITPPHNTGKKDELVRLFGLTPLLKHRFSQLSLGQQNRVNLVRYLVQEFDLLIMDESLANVDEKMRGRILVTLKMMFPNAIFLYISHNLVEVATYCKRIWILRGAHKSPQIAIAQGLDRNEDNAIPSRELQQSMLEIMNAA